MANWVVSILAAFAALAFFLIVLRWSRFRDRGGCGCAHPREAAGGCRRVENGDVPPGRVEP
ncbi:MAG: hypothetical protein RB296_08215 [Acidobacteriota bacterium]|nr:hypothetical protein [Acidobacteriota bacterium]